MSDNELDNLFRDKLDGLQRAPSPTAWEKIAAGTASPDERVGYPYLKIAATITIIAIVIILLINFKQPHQTYITKKSGTPIEQSALAEATVSHTDETPEKKEKSEPVLHSHEEHLSKKHDKAHNSESRALNSTTPHQPSDPHRSSHDAMPLKTIGTLTAIDSTHTTLSSNPALPKKMVVSTDQNQHKSQTLTFDISEFAKKKPVIAHQDSSNTRDNGLKRLLRLAKNIKEGDSGLAELREAKNELFALNFDKEKNESK